MIKSQFEKFKALALEQYAKFTPNPDKQKKLAKLADQQFADEFYADTEGQPQVNRRILRMPESNRSNWAKLDLDTKMIYVLRKSRAFTQEEIASKFGVSTKKVYRVFKRGI